MSAAGGSPPVWEATGMIAAPTPGVLHIRACWGAASRSFCDPTWPRRPRAEQDPHYQSLHGYRGTPLRFAEAIAMHRCQAAPAEA